MRLYQTYLFLASLAVIACTAPREASSSDSDEVRGSTRTRETLAKTPHVKLRRDRDTFIIDSRDTMLLDAIGQLYHWSIDNQIEKVYSVNQLGQTDTTRYRYHNPRLGRLTSVDFTNPIRPMLFYEDAQTVILLNRNLVEFRSINLLDFGFPAIDAIAYATNEGFWIYNSNAQKLIQIDRNGTVLFESTELSRVFNQAIRAEQLVANTQQIAMRTQKNRLLLFGPFGGYRSELLKGGTSLHLVKDRLVFYEGKRWWTYLGPQIPIEPVLEKKGKELVSIRAEFTLYRRGNRYWRETTNL